MAERITWVASGPFDWKGTMGNQDRFTLHLNVSTQEFTLGGNPGSMGSVPIAKSDDVLVLKAKAEEMLQNLVDQGLPLE